MFLATPSPFGLDISDLSIKLIFFKRKNLQAKTTSFKLAAFGQISVPEGCFDKGEIKDFEKVAYFIKKLCKNPDYGKIESPYLISVLPETKSFIKLIEIPFAENGNISEAIKEEIKKDIPVAIEETYLDWQIISRRSLKQRFDQNEDKIKIIVGISPKNIVDDYTLLLKKSGLKPLALEIESVAIARSLFALKETSNYPPVAILDLGATRSSVIIFDEGAIQLTSATAVSGQEISKNLALNLKISFSKAEKFKTICGLNNKKCQKIIDEILRPSIEILAKNAQEVIDFYQEQSNKKIGEILLCGGGANLKGLESFLSQKLKIKTKKGNPLINIPFKTPFSPSESLSYTTAIGLALRGIFSKD